MSSIRLNASKEFFKQEPEQCSLQTQRSLQSFFSVQGCLNLQYLELADPVVKSNTYSSRSAISTGTQRAKPDKISTYQRSWEIMQAAGNLEVAKVRPEIFKQTACMHRPYRMPRPKTDGHLVSCCALSARAVVGVDSRST